MTCIHLQDWPGTMCDDRKYSKRSLYRSSRRAHLWRDIHSARLSKIYLEINPDRFDPRYSCADRGYIDQVHQYQPALIQNLKRLPTHGTNHD